MTKIWVCRAGENEFGRDFMKRRVVAVSSCEPQHAYRSVDGMSMDDLRVMLDEFYPGMSKTDKSRRARELFLFVNTDDDVDGVCTGDLVLVPLDTKSIMYAVISGPYRFNADDPIGSSTGVFPHERPVFRAIGTTARDTFPSGTFVRSRLYRPKTELEIASALQVFVDRAVGGGVSSA